MSSNFPTNALTFDVVDIQLEERVDRNAIGCYVSVGKRLLDVLVLGDLEQKLRVALSKPADSIQIIIKFLGKDERKLGSVSLPARLFLEGPPNRTYKHWVTIFDHLDDDEFDGELGENDEECPRILLEYTTHFEDGKRREEEKKRAQTKKKEVVDKPLKKTPAASFASTKSQERAKPPAPAPAPAPAPPAPPKPAENRYKVSTLQKELSEKL